MLSNDISESKKNNEFVFQRDLKEILESIEIKKGKGMEGGGGGVYERGHVPISSQCSPLETPENQKFFDVFMGYKEEIFAWNE